jgi:hypothetical protein
MGFLRHHYRPRRHGLGLPFTLGWRLARQAVRTWRTFRDPLYLRGAAWRALFQGSTPRADDRSAEPLHHLAHASQGSVNGQ